VFSNSEKVKGNLFLNIGIDVLIIYFRTGKAVFGGLIRELIDKKDQFIKGSL